MSILILPKFIIENMFFIDLKYQNESNNQHIFIDEIIDAASGVRTYIETNHLLLSYVQILSGHVTLPDFLRILWIWGVEI